MNLENNKIPEIEPNKKNIIERHNVDMGNVSVPHFGVHLDPETLFKK